MLHSLNYGRGKLTLEIPEKNLLAERRPNLPPIDTSSGNQKILLEAINDFGILRISPIFAGRQVGVIIDAGNDTMLQLELLAVMLPFLRGARFVQFLLSTSNEASNHSTNQQFIHALQALIEDFEFPHYEIQANDWEQDEFVEIGKTARGTPVQVNARSAPCDLFFVIADLQNHESHGYTTPLLNFLPGLCSLQTLLYNASLARDERVACGQHPWHPDPQRRNNPLADDVWEGVQMLLRRRPVLALTAIPSHGQWHWAKLDTLFQATRTGIAKVDELMSFTLPAADYLIVSPGGYPDDANFFTAQRALALTKHAVAPHGEVLFLAYCANGIGPQNFYETLRQPLAEILQQRENNPAPGSHGVYQLAAMLQQLRVIHIHSNLPDAIVANIHLHPCADPQALVQQWLAQNPLAKINILDGASKLAIYPEINSGTKA